MNIPDTTTCHDAYRAYKQWDDEATLGIEVERLSEEFLSAINNEKEAWLVDIISDLLADNISFQNLVLSHLAQLFLNTFGPCSRRSQKPNPISIAINDAVNKGLRDFIKENL